MMHAIIVPTSNTIAYATRVDVELLHDGHALQHRPHAALPKQQAAYKKIVTHHNNAHVAS